MFNLKFIVSMETTVNPRTQGFKEGTRISFAEFKASKKALGFMIVKRLIKESVDKATGNVIPAHKALCFFIAKKDAQGNVVKGANGGPIAMPDTMFYVNFGPSVGEDITPAELNAQASELEVGELQSGTRVLYRPNYNGIEGEEV